MAGRRVKKHRHRGFRVLCLLALSAAAAAGILWRTGLLSPDGEDSIAETEEWSRVVAYVPLDDRTDNLEDVVLLAEASGYRVVLPERDWFRTALDGQPRNANGTAYGQREALLEWVRDMAEQGCRRFVLSLDQLFSGGLVNSRSISSPRPLSFSDGTVLTEAEAFRQFILPLGEDEENRVYLFDSVTRLSPTVGYRGLGTEEYYALREYGMVERPTLSESELTLQTVFDRYPYAADGVTPAENALGSDKFREYLTEPLLRDYLGVRRRKLALTDDIITALQAEPSGRIQLLVGIDDSSNAANIQYNELRYLEKRLGPGAALMAGLDSLARLLIGRMAQEEYGYRVRASVRYIGGTEGRHSSEFDLYTLEEVVDLHLDLFRAVRVPEEAAELQFVVMTAPDDWSRAAAYREELVSLLEYNLSRHIPTVLDEASNNAYGDALEQTLLDRVDFAGLVGFAGKYDQANVTGAAFAMGFSRYLYLRCHPAKDSRYDQAHLQQLATSMTLTEYILHARAPLNQYIEELELDRDNMQPDEIQHQKIMRKLRRLFLPDCRRVCDNLEHSLMIVSLHPLVKRETGTVDITDLYFPWNRTFELAFTVRTCPPGYRYRTGGRGDVSP